MKWNNMTLQVILLVSLLNTNHLIGQNSQGQSDDFSRIAIAPVIPVELRKLPAGAQEMLLGKMRQIIGLNGMSALDNAPLFIMTPQLMVISSDVAPTTPPVYTYNMEIVLNLADRYTGNVYATASQPLKGAGRTEQAAYNNAFKMINERDGKYKAMLLKGKEAIIEYFNAHCDLVISRAKSLADQYNWVGSLGLLNSVPPVCRECFDKCNEVAGEIGRNMPVIITAVDKAKNETEPEYTEGQTIDLGNKIFLRFKKAVLIGDKIFVYFELINKGEEDYIQKMYRLYETMLINENGDEKRINMTRIGSRESNNYLDITILPVVNTELICEFPKVKEIKFLRFFINDNFFKFKDLPITK
jgi:hypothetical protein